MKTQTIKELERTINEETSPFLIQVETELNRYRQEIHNKQERIRQLELVNNEVIPKSFRTNTCSYKVKMLY